MNAFLFRLVSAAMLLAVVSTAPPPVAATRSVDGSGDSLTLGAVLRDVAVGNPSLASRRAMVDAAEARTGPAGAWDAPMLELGVANVPLSGGFDEDEMTMKMVGIAQRVPLFGPNGLRRRAALEQAIAEGTVSEREHLERFAEAIEAYADAYFALERAREASRHRGATERFVEAARARYRSGSGRLDEVLRAEAERARVLVDEAAFQAEAVRSRARLDVLRGREPDGSAPPLSPPPPWPLPSDPAAWLAAAREGHPRLRETEARQRGYQLAARAAGRTTWPGVDLRAAYGQRGRDAHGMQLADMFSASVGFTLPLFTGSREGAMATEMNAMARAAAEDRRGADLDLAREARSLHADAAAAARMVALLADTVVATQERAVEATWSAYAAGAGDLGRVFEASHALYGEDLLLLDARRTLARAQGRVVALTGRGDLAGLELPVLRRDGR